MRAVLFTLCASGQPPVVEHQPLIMLPLVDRPFLQHVVEQLVQQGMKTIDVVLSDHPRVVEEFLGDGTRWGANIRYHLERDPVRPYGALRSLGLDGEGSHFLLAHADCLPEIGFDSAAASSGDAIYYSDGDSAVAGGWTGWGWLDATDVRAIPRQATREELEVLLAGRGASRRHFDTSALSAHSLAHLLSSQRAALGGAFTSLLRTGREVEPGIWLSRNSVVAPGVRVEPPVFVGPDTRIERGVQLGPNAVIGGGCVIDAGTDVRDSLVAPGTYVGEGLEISGSLVQQAHLTNVSLGTSTTVTEPFILCATEGKTSQRRFAQLAGRLCALSVLALAAPVLVVRYLLRLLAGRPGLVALHATRIPNQPGQPLRTFSVPALEETSAARVGWRHLLWKTLPGLWCVLLGRMDLVGLPPRSPQEVAALPPEWRRLYLSSRAGLVSEALVTFGPSATDAEAYAADSYYSAMSSCHHDLRLLARYVRQLITNREPLERVTP